MNASFLNLPVEGRHSRALHLKLFTVPSVLTTFYELINLKLKVAQKRPDTRRPKPRGVRRTCQYAARTRPVKSSLCESA